MGAQELVRSLRGKEHRWTRGLEHKSGLGLLGERIIGGHMEGSTRAI